MYGMAQNVFVSDESFEIEFLLLLSLFHLQINARMIFKNDTNMSTPNVSYSSYINHIL